MYFQILVSLVVGLGLINNSYATNCRVSAPESTLDELNSGCYLDWRSRTPVCVSAMHDFCNRIVYPGNIRTTLGISRQVLNQSFAISCVKASWYGDVNVGELNNYNPDCLKYRSQHTPCLSAIHQYCINRLASTKAAGISQVMAENDDVLSIGCFIATHIQNVSISVMTNLNPGCIWPNADTPECFEAASSYCSEYLGYAGGFMQELNGKDTMTVACYNAEFSGDVFVIRNTDFYEAINDVDKVCSLDFMLDKAKILQTTPNVLIEQWFDNRESEVEMSDVFAVSKSITLTHKFYHSHRFRIAANTTFKTGIPFLANGEMTLSAFDPGGFSLTKENSKTITYETTSYVNLPAGKAITKSAIITRANLKVPWTAKIVNKLGRIHTIGGKWRGVDAYNLRIVQEDMV